MLTLHPEIVTKKGNKKFAILPYKEFLAIQEKLEDADDLMELNKAKRAGKNKPTISLAQVKKDLGLA